MEDREPRLLELRGVLGRATRRGGDEADALVDHEFHDVRDQGLDQDLVSQWLDSEYGDVLMNRRSTTWRTLTQSQKESQGAELVKLLLDYPTLIKRPVFVDGRVLAVGFSPAKLLHVLKPPS